MKKYIATEGKRGRIFMCRLTPGQDVIAGITTFLKEKKVVAGFIPVVMGGFKKVTLTSMRPGANENQPVDITKSYEEPLEYFGQGTIAQHNGELSLHIHVTAAREGNSSLAGHLVSGEVVLVTEIVVIEITGVEITREADPEVFNLPLLKFK